MSLELMSHGHHVLGISRSNCSHLKHESGGTYSHLSCDLMSHQALASLIPAILDHMPRIDILVNNAGLLVNKNFFDLSTEDLDRMYRMHLRIPFELIGGLSGAMPAGSHIVNVASMGAFQGSVKFAGLSGYSATKGALAVLSEALATELKEKGISVNCLAIGAVQTEMLSLAFPGYKAPLEPEDFASFAAWFCLEGNRFFNGKILPVSLSTP